MEEIRNEHKILVQKA